MRAVTPDDLPLLARWFADEHFVQWWGGVPLDTPTVERTYLSHEPGVERFILLEGEQPIGYGQTWIEDGESGVDLVLVAPFRGRGLGTLAIRLLTKRLFDAGCKRVLGDPHRDNAISIRAFEKAGFHKTGETRGSSVILEARCSRHG